MFRDDDNDEFNKDLDLTIRLFGKQYEFVHDTSYASAMIGGVGSGKCYDDKTEILTEERGWVLFRDLTPDDRVAVMTDVNHGLFTFEFPRAYIDEPYEGVLLEFASEAANLCVTPDHDLLVCKEPDTRVPSRGKRKIWEKRKAKNVFNRTRLAMRAKCFFDTHDDAYNPKLFEFLGIFFTCGTVVTNRNMPYVKLSHDYRNSYVVDVLKDLCIEFVSSFQYPVVAIEKLYSPSLVELCQGFLDGNGLKRVPSWIKNAHPKYTRAFIRGYWDGRVGYLGEGKDKAGVGTSGFWKQAQSKELADDVQEVGYRCGTVIHIIKLGNRSTSEITYGLSITTHDGLFPTVDSSQTHSYPYNGRVYCVDVGGKPIFVRRNNLPVWSYNSLALCYKSFLKCVEEPGIQGVVTSPCYDSQTKVMTEHRGWQYFRDLMRGEKVATLLDDQSDKFEFIEPTEVFDYEYNGDLICAEGQEIDLAVTPNHNLLTRFKNTGPWRKIPAGELCGKWDYYFRKTASWTGGSTDKSVDYFEFMGLWFAEGSASTKKYSITITQKHRKDYVEGVLETVFPGKWHVHKRSDPDTNNYVVYGKALSEEFAVYGKCTIKRLPAFIKEAPIQHLRAFLWGYLMGDGHVGAKNQTNLYTSSPNLADDLQEILLKCGYSSNVKTTKRGEYVVAVKSSRGVSTKVVKGQWSRRHYEGRVYCVNVNDRPILVQRNGKHLWCFNTYPLLRDSTLRTWWDVCPRTMVDWSASELVATFKYLGYNGGSRVSFRNTTHPDLLRGTNLGFWAMDEGTLSAFQAWLIGIARVRLLNYHRQLFVATSPRGFDWVYDTFVGKERPNYHYYRVASYENPFLPMDMLQSMLETYSATLYKQEVEGMFVQFEGAVFPSFDPAVHCGVYKYKPGIPVWLAVDFGYTNPYGVLALQLDAHGRIFVFDEEYRTKCTDEDMTSIMRAKPYWKDVMGGVADSAEPDRIERLAKLGWPIKSAKKSTIPTMIESIRVLLEQDRVLQTPMLLIDSSCESLINEFKLYMYPDDKVERNLREIPIDRYNHLISSLFYYVGTFWNRMAGIELPSGPQERKVMSFQRIGQGKQPIHSLLARENLSKIR